MNSDTLILHGQVRVGCDLHENELCMITVRLHHQDRWWTAVDAWSPLSEAAPAFRIETIERLCREAIQGFGWTILSVAVDYDDTITVRVNPGNEAVS